MKVVRIWGPSGGTLAIFEVVVKMPEAVVSLIRAPDGGTPREARGRYASLADALKRNNRATTTAEAVEVADIQAARALVM